ncbi:MAG: flagellin-like protein [Ruminococcaceae bacterium]|nr:flagellin-like protein [Oscillospiraceae bacterium]
MFKMWLQAKLNKLFKDEKGETTIVTMVVLIGIAVVLAIIFKDAILGLINSLLAQITGGAENAIKGP